MEKSHNNNNKHKLNLNTMNIFKLGYFIYSLTFTGRLQCKNYLSQYTSILFLLKFLQAK